MSLGVFISAISNDSSSPSRCFVFPTYSYSNSILLIPMSFATSHQPPIVDLGTCLSPARGCLRNAIPRASISHFPSIPSIPLIDGSLVLLVAVQITLQDDGTRRLAIRTDSAHCGRTWSDQCELSKRIGDSHIYGSFDFIQSKQFISAWSKFSVKVN